MGVTEMICASQTVQHVPYTIRPYAHPKRYNMYQVFCDVPRCLQPNNSVVREQQWFGKLTSDHVLGLAY